MKLSELIEKSQELLEKYGDGEVYSHRFYDPGYYELNLLRKFDFEKYPHLAESYTFKEHSGPKFLFAAKGDQAANVEEELEK